MLVSLSAVVALAALSTPARAQSADERYLAGKAALEGGAFDQAVREFEAGLEAGPREVLRWQLLIGLALTHEARGDHLAALLRYRAFVERAHDSPVARSDKWSERLALARRSIVELEAKVLVERGALTLEAFDEAAKAALITVSGEGLDEQLRPPALFYLEPGRYRVSASGDGAVPYSRTVELHAGQRLTVRVALPPLPAPEPPPAETVVRAPAPQPESRDEAWIPIGFGAASLAAGGVLTGLALADSAEVSELSDAPATKENLAEHKRLTDRGKSRQTWAWVSYGVGVAALGAGLVWLLTGDEAESDGALEISVGPGGYSLRF